MAAVGLSRAGGGGGGCENGPEAGKKIKKNRAEVSKFVGPTLQKTGTGARSQRSSKPKTALNWLLIK